MDVLKHFRTIEEVTKTLSGEHRLLSEMFEKRKLMKFPQALALDFVGGNEARLRKLVDYGVLVATDNSLEIESDYLNFFEEILNVNEQISVLSVQECIDTLKENIGYFLQETNVNRKARYQDRVRLLLKKTGFRTLKNVVDLKRNMDNTYKQEPNYIIKKKKLQNLDEKSHSIREMIRECEKLMDNEQAFFLMANDPHMAQTCSDVRHDFVEAYHAMMEIDRQIITYINQIDQQNQLFKKIRKLKYLQDQLLIKTDTNIIQVLEERNPLWMESRQYNKVRLSLEMLRENDIKHIRPMRLKSLNHSKKNTIGMAINAVINRCARLLMQHLPKTSFTSLEELDSLQEEIDVQGLQDKVKLLGFIPDEDHAALFCQLVTLHPDECRFTKEYSTYKNIEYPIIYAK